MSKVFQRRILSTRSKMRNNKDLYRIIDANFNRTKEGLRVSEDISRYIWNQKTLTKAFKSLRHDLTDVMKTLNTVEVLKARDVLGDVGRPSVPSELKRKDIASVFFANIQRVKESLRVLEEIAKLISPKASEGFKQLRYKAYVLEQKAVKVR
jgi:hypothetical protein